METTDESNAVPIELPVGKPEKHVLDALESWLTDVGRRLYAVIGRLDDSR
ncbi:hypothetical protein [Geodermatophilus amargosae]|nr:hypothetical protein [Geodermatophilus amargosae]